MQINFGEYSGQTVEEISKTEKGMGWLAWIVRQPTDDPKYAKYRDPSEKRNDYIRKFLSGIDDSVSESPSIVPVPEPEDTASKSLKMIIGQNDEIIRQNDDILRIVRPLPPGVTTREL